MDPDVWEALEAAVEARQLVIFAGAGVSAAGGLPLWPRLTERLIERMQRDKALEDDAEEAAGHFKATRYVTAISIAQHALGDKVFGDFVKAQLDDKGKDPPALAVAIAALHNKLHGVVTTNLDRFLERAGRDWVDLVKPTGDLVQESGFLWKAHGTLQDRATWVFSRPSYDRVMFGDPQYRATFGALYWARKLLFVGCGLADDDLDLTLGEVRALAGDQPPTHFAIVEEGMGRHRQRELERAGIRLIPYTKGQHDKVIELLKALGGTAPVPAAPPPPSSAVPPVVPPVPAPPVVASANPPHAPHPAPPPGNSHSGGGSIPTVSPSKDESSITNAGRLVKLFCCYHSSDEDHYEQLKKHLSGLTRNNKLEVRGTGEVPVGADRVTTWNKEVHEADLVVFLLSADLTADDDLDRLAATASRRAKDNLSLLVPVRVRPAPQTTTSTGCRPYHAPVPPTLAETTKTACGWASPRKSALLSRRPARAPPLLDIPPLRGQPLPPHRRRSHHHPAQDLNRHRIKKMTPLSKRCGRT